VLALVNFSIDRLLLSALLFATATASALATRIGRDLLAPPTPDPTPGHGARCTRSAAAWSTAPPRHRAQALAVMATNRFACGVIFIATILISRDLLENPANASAGPRMFGAVLAASAVGFVLPVVLTPVLSPRTGPHAWIVPASCWPRQASP
jgi:hypothetical protein